MKDKGKSKKGWSEKVRGEEKKRKSEEQLKRESARILRLTASKQCDDLRHGL